MQETHSTGPAVGSVLDAPRDLAGAVAHARAHPGPLEITLGPERPVGLHLGSHVQRHAGEQLREAGARPLILRAPVAVDEDIPDEGVIATVDDALGLARGLGAGMLVLALGGVTHRGRQRQRLYSMIAALSEAASARGVRLMVQNNTLVVEVVMLLALLDREYDQGTLDVAQPETTSLAWDVSRSRAAGQDDAAAWDFVRRAAARAPVLVRGLEPGETRRLRRALPGLDEALAQGRVLALEHGPEAG